MEIVEALVVEEFMDGIGQSVAYAEHTGEGIRAGTQMGDVAEEFQRVALLLEGVFVGGGCAVDFEAVGLDLYALPFAGGLYESALHMDRGAGCHRAELLLAKFGEVEYDLQGID